jgi:uncharacterized membrane protein YphA (DoxX/SURF4 family)
MGSGGLSNLSEIWSFLNGAAAAVTLFLLLCARTLELVAGLRLALGIYPQRAAVPLLVFSIPTTFTAPAFWQVIDTAAYTPHLINYLKNTAKVGALLFYRSHTTVTARRVLPSIPRRLDEPPVERLVATWRCNRF